MNRSANSRKQWGRPLPARNATPGPTRNRMGRKLLVVLSLLAGFFLLAASIADARERGKPDGIKRGRRAEIARDHVRDHCDELGLDLEDVEDTESREYESRHNSTTHINLSLIHI